MRILVAHDSLDTAGGVETYLGAVVPALEANGHTIALLYNRRRRRADGPLAACGVAIGVEEAGLESAMASVRRFRPDVCFSHNMSPLEVEHGLLREWPVVKMMHGYFGTCVSGLKSHAFPSRCACSRPLGAGCLGLYGPRRCGRLDLRQMLHDYRWAREQQGLVRRYAALVVASEHMGREFRQNGASDDRVHVIPLFSTFAIEEVDAARPHSVLFAGRMTALKGGDVLVRAAAEASRWLGQPIRLVMAGDGPQRTAWQQLASRLDVAAEFPGWLEGPARADAFRNAALLAVPSLWPEPFGLVGLEAGSFGVPAVAFDVGGIREWLVTGRTGTLIDPEEGASGLARSLAALLSNRAERDRLGDGARNAARHYSIPTHVNRLQAVLETAARARLS